MTPVRVGFEPNVAHEEGALGGERAGDQEERGGGDVARHVQVGRLELAAAPERRPPALALDRHAERPQHPLGVVARDGGLAHRGLALGVEPGEQDRGLDLRARDFELVVDALAGSPRRAPSPADGRRSCRCARPSFAAAPRRAPSAGAISDASPVSVASKAWPASSPIESRIAVPALPMSSGRAGAARPWRPTPSMMTRPGAGRSTLTPMARIARSVARQSSLSRKPSTSVVPSAMPPRSTARCEIDLSPGTSTSPRTQPPAATW